jgi:hypothetical protein
VSVLQLAGCAPRRGTRTYVMGDRECYADTGRPVDERLGTHVVLWIVEDAEAWATAIEADADAEPGRWGKGSRYIGEQRRLVRRAGAAQVRERGARRDWRTIMHRREDAEAAVHELYRSQPNPGVRYEVAEITGYGACPTCQQPIVEADGEWRHHFLRYPADCDIRPEPEPEPEPEPGQEWWVIDADRGEMTCGYCGDAERWPEVDGVVGGATLTGYHLLGIEKATGVLVVLAEAETLDGRIGHLPHHCTKIPADVVAKYAEAPR